MNLMPERPGASLPASDVMFGARLRMERERRRITLASIAANTKIGLHLLEGLERGQVDALAVGYLPPLVHPGVCGSGRPRSG